MRTFLVTAVLTAAALAQEGARPYLGVQVGNVDQETRAHYELPNDVEAGAVLIRIHDGTAAAKAGLLAGDVVTSFAGKPVKKQEDLIELVGAQKAGAKVAYVVRRGTGVIKGNLTLGILVRDGPTPLQPEPPRPARRAPAPPGGELDQRLDRLQTDIEALRKRLLAAKEKRAAASRPLRHPRSIGGWLHREEQLAKAARERGDDERYRYHAIRMTVLREMLEANQTVPARQLDRVEKKLDTLLERIEKRK